MKFDNAHSARPSNNDGIKLTPEAIPSFLASKQLAWHCFCLREEARYELAVFVKLEGGDVVATCQKGHTGCGFMGE